MKTTAFAHTRGKGGGFLFVSEIMGTDVVSIDPEESVSLAARLLARHNIGAIPVCTKAGFVRGMVTDRDVVLRCVAREENPKEMAVGEMMSRDVYSVSPQDDVRKAMHLMAQRKVRRLPVVEDGKLTGMISLGDLAQCHGCDMEASRALADISGQLRRL